MFFFGKRFRYVKMLNKHTTSPASSRVLGPLRKLISLEGTSFGRVMNLLMVESV